VLTTSEAFVVGAVVVGAFQVYVSLRLLLSSAYTLGRKLRQVLVIWLLPLFGAVIVYLFMQSDSTRPAKRDSAFTAAVGGNPEAIGPGDGEHGS
jgi:fructose-specific phosphotransferase system IIC component